MSDHAVAVAAADLARLGVPAGPCGAAALAAARDVAASPELAVQLGVTGQSVVVLVCTEGQDAKPKLAGEQS